MTAPVSGPGPYSQRTDRQPVRNPGGLPYGDNQALAQIQAAAPMAQSSTPTAPPTPFSAPTERPGEPVTAGANAGAGPDASILAQRPNVGRTAGQSTLIQALSNAAAVDTSGALGSLLLDAMKRGL